MPSPFLIPAGMIAVKVGGKWILRKIKDHLKKVKQNIAKRKGASVTKQTAKPESSMKTKKKATRTREQLTKLNEKLRRNETKLDKKLGRFVKTVHPRTDATGGQKSMIEEKGGLLKDVQEFKRNLEKQDMSTDNIVQAYKRLRLWKTDRKKPSLARYAKARQKEDAGYIRRKFYPRGDATSLFSEIYDSPLIKKLMRDDKRRVKEAYKKQIKKDRTTRKYVDKVMGKPKKRRVKDK